MPKPYSVEFGRRRLGPSPSTASAACRTNQREAYKSFAELEAACVEFCETVNARVHRVTRRTPTEMLAEERPRLHPAPAAAHTVSFGVATATVDRLLHHAHICRTTGDSVRLSQALA